MTLQQRQVQSLRGPRTATLSGEDPACVCDPACCKSRPRSLKILLFSRFPHHNYVLFSFSRCFSRCSGRHTARCQQGGIGCRACQPIRIAGHRFHGGEPGRGGWQSRRWRSRQTSRPTSESPPPVHSRHRPGENDGVGTAPRPPSSSADEPPFLSPPRTHTCSWNWGRDRTGRTANGRQRGRLRR